MISRLKFIIAILLTFCLLLSSCSAKASPEEALNSLINAEVGRGAGTAYSLSAPEGTEGYISDTALLSIYGFDRGLEGLSSGAIYLSDFCHPVEFAVFICDNTYALEDVAMHLKNRITSLSKNAAESAVFCGMREEEYRAYIDSAEVVISGHCVALIISSDTSEAMRTLLHTL